MSCVATKIVAAPWALVGSIGVIAQMPNINKLLKKNLVDFEMHTAGEFKRTLTVFGENTEEGRNKFKSEHTNEAILDRIVRVNVPYCLEFDQETRIYQKMIDRNCKMKLNEATGIWSASQDLEAATEAAKLLATIEPQSSCFSDVSKLFKKIQTRVYKLDARDWDYKLKELNQTSELIKAYRDIGVATGENQPQNVTYNYNAISRW